MLIILKTTQLLLIKLIILKTNKNMVLFCINQKSHNSQMLKQRN